MPPKLHPLENEEQEDGDREEEQSLKRSTIRMRGLVNY